ncbi:MAG: dehydrogenase, partial [Saprospiraceae bacterium]
MARSIYTKATPPMPGKYSWFFFLLAFHACRQDFPEPVVSLDEFQLEKGFRIECAAAEPMVQVPVAMAFDERNRMWVVEMTGFMPNADAVGEDAPVGKIVILEDRDGDGAVDHRRIFLDSLVLPRALAFAGNGLLYCEPPKLWFVEIDHDRPGKRILVDSLYAPGANPEYQANGLLRGIGNWYYSANSGRRYRYRHRTWESEPARFRGQWGMTQDEFGRLFYNYNSNQLVGDYVLPDVLEKNPAHKPQFGIGKQICTDPRVYPARATIVNRGYQKGELDENGRLVNFTSACGPHIYTGDDFPPEFHGNAFVCAPEAYLVKRDIFDETEGVALTARQAYEGREFLASTDETFRPVTLLTGPDGCLYVLDMRKGIIQHRAYMSSYLHEQVLKNGLDTITGKGRIYRICAGGKKEKKSVVFAGKSDLELARLLAHPNGAVRLKAQQILVDRQAKRIVPELRQQVL